MIPGINDTVLKHIDRARVVGTLADLVRLNSVNPPGNEAPVARYVADALAGAGLDTSVIGLAENRANVVARLRGNGARPGLMFCGHLDTVHPGQAPWQRDPFGAEMAGGRMYGRGTADMKGGLAAVIAAVTALARAGVELQGDVIVAGTAGEEVDCLGARQLLASGELNGVGALVVPEPTGLALASAHRGAQWLRLTTRGKAAHGSMPQLGVNAILHMGQLLDRIRHHRFECRPHPLLAPPTVNAGTIQGGTQINVVPEWCQAEVDIRTLPGQSAEGIVEEIQGLASDLHRKDPSFHARIEVIDNRPAVMTDPQAPLIQAAQRVAQSVLGRELMPCGLSYFTDASVLAPPTGVPTLIFGPGEAAMAHQTDEHVEIDAVLAAARFYAALALELLAG